jgi:hypothetical protein
MLTSMHREGYQPPFPHISIGMLRGNDGCTELYALTVLRGFR